MTKPEEAKKPEEVPEEEPEDDDEDEEVEVQDFNEAHPPVARRKKPIRQEQAEANWDERISLRFW